MGRALRVLFVVLVACFGGTARAQVVCSESTPCVHTIGSPGRFASIGAHRMLFANGELVWPSFIDVFALDLATGHTRTLPHCGTSIGDIALEGSYVYMLADHAMLCRVSLASGQGVQMLVNAVDTVVEGFAVSSAAVAYSMRRRGEQPELRVLQWNGQSHSFVTAVTVEHVVVDAAAVYWIDAGSILRASLATGAKTVGPSVANHVRRLQVVHGVVYVATDHEVMRLDASGTSWTTLAHEGADDLAADETAVYWTNAARGTLTKLATTNLRRSPTPLGSPHKPYALALDATSIFIAEDDPFVLEQIVPR